MNVTLDGKDASTERWMGQGMLMPSTPPQHMTPRGLGDAGGAAAGSSSAAAAAAAAAAKAATARSLYETEPRRREVSTMPRSGVLKCEYVHMQLVFVLRRTFDLDMASPVLQQVAEDMHRSAGRTPGECLYNIRLDGAPHMLDSMDGSAKVRAAPVNPRLPSMTHAATPAVPGQGQAVVLVLRDAQPARRAGASARRLPRGGVPRLLMTVAAHLLPRSS